MLMSGDRDEIALLATSGVQFLKKPFHIKEFERLIAQKVRQ